MKLVKKTILYSKYLAYPVVRHILEPILRKHMEAKMPIAVRSKETLKKRNKAPELERLESKRAPPSNMSSQEEKRREMVQLQLE
ncbi:27487_t:CDS:2, partial [Gigaspora margarita]